MSECTDNRLCGWLCKIQALFNVCHLFVCLFVCLFVLLLYVPSQQLWSWGEGQFHLPHFFLGKLEQAVNQYSVHILLLVTDNVPS